MDSQTKTKNQIEKDRGGRGDKGGDRNSEREMQEGKAMTKLKKEMRKQATDTMKKDAGKGSMY